jgi:hypothetical protein
MAIGKYADPLLLELSLIPLSRVDSCAAQCENTEPIGVDLILDMLNMNVARREYHRGMKLCTGGTCLRGVSLTCLQSFLSNPDPVSQRSSMGLLNLHP